MWGSIALGEDHIIKYGWSVGNAHAVIKTSRHCEVSRLAAAVSCGDLIKTALKKTKLTLNKVT